MEVLRKEARLKLFTERIEKVREKKSGKRMKKRMTGPRMLNTESTIGLEKETLLMMYLIQILLLNSNGWRSETKRM